MAGRLPGSTRIARNACSSHRLIGRTGHGLDAASSNRRQLSIKPSCTGSVLEVFLTVAFFFADRR